MRILQLHNFYQRPGGEDQVFAAEGKLLVSHGHSVEQCVFHNSDLDRLSKWDAARKTFWNSESFRAIEQRIASFKPDIIHAYNSFPLASPAVYYAAAAAGVPVIQTVQNFRLICPGSTLYRDGHVCEDCLRTITPYPAILHRCYRGLLGATAVTAAMITAHRVAGTWTRKIHTYIAPTKGAKLKFIEGGLPADKIVVKSNFLSPDPGAGTGEGNYALFLGRLCEEKGIRTLLQAWRQLPHIPLKIASDGPMRDFVIESIRTLPNVTWLGHQEHSKILQMLKEALVLIFPSEWYEGQPLAIIEAAASGTPVILSDLGAMGEWARESGLGMTFVPGDAVGLAKQVQALVSQPDDITELRAMVRQHYLAHYTAEGNYQQLIGIYERALIPSHA